MSYIEAKHELELSMSSDVFNQFKMDFDRVLSRTLGNMEKHESEEAEISIKLKIDFTKDLVPDNQVYAYNAEREAVLPTFSHKISSVMKIKDETSGKLGGNYELVWDKETKQYILRPINSGGPLFNSEYNNSDSNHDAEDPKTLPGPPPQLEAGTIEENTNEESANIIEADFTELPDKDDD